MIDGTRNYQTLPEAGIIVWRSQRETLSSEHPANVSKYVRATPTARSLTLIGATVPRRLVLHFLRRHDLIEDDISNL